MVLPMLFYFALSRQEKNMLKGQCHEIFDFRFFSCISFPKAPEYPIQAVEFFRKFVEIFADQGLRWQMENSSIRKILNLFKNRYRLHQQQICRRCR
jgi:hypothetical protein